MLLESFSQAILRWLRVPPGASVRKANEGTSSAVDINSNDYIQTILSITVDDVCIGDEPLSIRYDPSTPRTTYLKLEQINKEFNSIVKDIAYDLLAFGYSVYDVEISKTNQLLLFPYLESCEFYLTKDKTVALFEEGGKKQLTNKLIFINYNKRSLQKEEKVEGAKFKITPTPIQLNNAERTVSGLVSAENSVARFRALLRPVRYANVDIGAAQGDVQTQTVNSIASAINCNSESLGNGAPFTEFDDNIPVLPNRKGLGKVEIGENIPNVNIKELADVDYWLSKLNLLMRFPGTYMDFTKALSESAVSMIRGDLRYVKLIKTTQSKIVSTINDFIQSSKFKRYHPVVALTTLPTSEDDDVINAMSQYVDLLTEVVEFVMGEQEDSKEVCLQRLRMLQDLFATSTNSPMLQKWFDDLEYFISTSRENLANDENDEDITSGLENDESIDEGIEESPDIPAEVEEFENNEEQIEESPDIEFLEPSSNG